MRSSSSGGNRPPVQLAGAGWKGEAGALKCAPSTSLTLPQMPYPATLVEQRLFVKDGIPHGWMAVSRYSEIEVRSGEKRTKRCGDAVLTAAALYCGSRKECVGASRPGCPPSPPMHPALCRPTSSGTTGRGRRHCAR